MVNFPTWIPDCDFDGPTFFYFFLSPVPSICSTMAFLPLGNFDHLVSVSINFPMGWSLWFPREDIFKLSGTSAEASKFCELLQVGIDVLIPHHKYQVKLDLSQWFPAACAAAIVHRFFVCLYQQNKSSECKKLSWDKIVIIAKRVLEASKLSYVNKTKESINSQKLGSQDFCWIANSVLNKGKSAIPPLFNGNMYCNCL